MNVQQTDTDDPNAAVLLDEEGLCAYGKLPEDAIGQITDEEVRDLNEELTKVSGTMDDFRKAASETLQEFGYSEVQWPLPEEDMEKIRDGQRPKGLFLTHLTYSTRSTGIQNGSHDA